MEELIELSQLAVGLAVLVFFLVVVVRPVIRPQLAAQIYRAQLEAKGLNPAIALPPSLAGERARALAEGIAAVKAEVVEAKKAADAQAEADAAAAVEIEEGESLEQFKARMKSLAPAKKSNITADMLDTANNYDDKVALVKMLVTEDSGRVAAVLKNMLRNG